MMDPAYTAWVQGVLTGFAVGYGAAIGLLLLDIRNQRPSGKV